jgi:amino acid transporter
MGRIKEVVLGKSRDLRDPDVFHKVSLIAVLAWVGLGADGLSSSAYGPEEAYRALVGHKEMAVLLALAMTATVMIISYAYSKLIEDFPAGGGGYLVSTKLLGPSFGVVSGAALLVDYVLTITTSVAAAMDQTFSFLPAAWAHNKLWVEVFIFVLLVIMNLRGLKESVLVVAPIFMFFVLTHIIILVGALFVHGSHLQTLPAQVVHATASDYKSIGMFGLMALLFGAYARGAGTYTGIEAVSNGVPIMRDPKIRTAKKTMLYMSLSLAITAGGILLCYLLADVRIPAPEEGKTLNAVLIESLGFGNWFVIAALLAEAGLLVVAAQTGFIDGPRVMANMALDGWIPRHFAALSDRLTMDYGILLMGGAGLASLFYTGGDITTLVTMYSINVFVTFSLSQIGMCRLWWQRRSTHTNWMGSLTLHVVAAVLCSSILVVVVIQKFRDGAWVTVVVTGLLVGLCYLIRQHYRNVTALLARLSGILEEVEQQKPSEAPRLIVDRKKPVAVVLVGGYGGLGVHTLLTILRLFPRHYDQVIFASISVIDTGHFKGADDVQLREHQTHTCLDKYTEIATKMDLAVEVRSSTGTDPIAEAEKLCTHIAQEFPRAVFYGGKLVFQKEKWYQKLLHNEMAQSLQRRLQFRGVAMVVLPVRA